MKERRKFILSLLTVMLLSAALTASFRYAKDHWSRGAPYLECPETLDLGDCYRGEIAVGRFYIKNSGGGLLTAKNFQTSCSCAGVEREIDGHPSRIQSVALSAGEAVELSVRVGVGARTGESQIVYVFFDTNDPDHPSWKIDVIISHVRGGYVAQPPAVVFGSLSLGERASRTIDLYDNGAAGRRIESVRAVTPDRFAVTLLPVSEEDQKQVHGAAGKLLARLQVTPRSERPGRFDGTIEVSLAKETHRAEPIPVLGEIVGTVECRPSALVLPRHVAGRPVLAGDVLIFNRREKPIEVAIENLPPEVVADLQGIPGRPDQFALHIEWRGRKTGGTLPEVRIHLRVRAEGQDSRLEVPVILTENRS